MSPSLPDVVAVVPAAGSAARLGPLTCSKEVLPLFWERDEAGEPRAVSGIDLLLRSLAASGVSRAVVLLREGKWDVAARICDGADHGLEVAFRILADTGSVVETLLSATPFLGEGRVALGFPDIVYRPAESFAALAHRQEETGAAVVLGLFPCDVPELSDMVRIDDRGRVIEVRVKAPDVGLPWAWGQALWDARFTAFLQETLDTASGDREVHPGPAVQRAIDQGLDVRGVPFPDGVFLDVGTPEGMERAREFLGTAVRDRSG